MCNWYSVLACVRAPRALETDNTEVKIVLSAIIYWVFTISVKPLTIDVHSLLCAAPLPFCTHGFTHSLASYFPND